MRLWIEAMRRQLSKGLDVHAAGFTLVELVLATLISALVVGIFSVALSISLRAWERQQNRQPSDVPSLLQLLKWQLAAFEPLDMSSAGGTRKVFEGSEQSLAFATAYSVRAISKGIPVVARYQFVPGRGELYYAELPLDPYHHATLDQFLKLRPGATTSRPHFYVTEVAEFALSYVGKDREALDASMDGTGKLPVAVMVKCTAKGSSESITALLFVSSPFEKTSQQITSQKPNFPGSRIRGVERKR